MEFLLFFSEIVERAYIASLAMLLLAYARNEKKSRPEKVAILFLHSKRCMIVCLKSGQIP